MKNKNIVSGLLLVGFLGVMGSMQAMMLKVKCFAGANLSKHEQAQVAVASVRKALARLSWVHGNKNSPIGEKIAVLAETFEALDHFLPEAVTAADVRFSYEQVTATIDQRPIKEQLEELLADFRHTVHTSEKMMVMFILLNYFEKSFGINNRAPSDLSQKIEEICRTIQMKKAKFLLLVQVCPPEEIIKTCRDSYYPGLAFLGKHLAYKAWCKGWEAYIMAKYHPKETAYVLAALACARYAGVV